MRSLLDFIVRHGSAFLFILLEGLSLLLLFGLNDKHNKAFMTSAGSISGSFLSMHSSMGEYFSLKRENLELAAENAMLHDRLDQLVSDSIEDWRQLSTTDDLTVLARVIDNSIRKDNNYITIDRGLIDGVRKGMGVYNGRGAIGVIMLTGNRNSIVLPILNTRTSISCKIKGTDNFGFLEWKGRDPYKASLGYIPYQSQVFRGDTIVTSGLSSAFPAETMLGTVSEVLHPNNSTTLDISIDLAVDMTDLGWVYVYTGQPDPELEELQLQLSEQK